MSKKEAKEELNDAFKNFNCSHDDKGACSCVSNPFGLEQVIDKIFESIEPKNVLIKYEQKYNGKSIMYSSADLEYGEEVIVTIQKKQDA